MFLCSLADLFVVVVITEFCRYFIFRIFRGADGFCKFPAVFAARFLCCLVRIPLAAESVIYDIKTDVITAADPWLETNKRSVCLWLGPYTNAWG